MIIRLIILSLLWFLQSAVNLLPIGNLPDGVYNSVALAFSYLAGWDSIFPISEFVQILKLVIAFQFVVWGWKGLVWLYGRIRGVSSH